MSERNVKYPKDMRENAKARGKHLWTLSVEAGRLGGIELQSYADDSVAVFLANFGVVLQMDSDLDKAIESGKKAVAEKIAKGTIKEASK